VTSVADTENWPERLRQTGPELDAALDELRSTLVKGLGHMMRGRNSSLQAEDVVQDAIIKILDKLDTFEGRSKFTMLGDELKFEVAASDSGVSGQESDKETILNKLKELISSKLTGKQRLAVNALLNGMPVEEIARRTDSNRNAVYKGR